MGSQQKILEGKIGIKVEEGEGVAEKGLEQQRSAEKANEAMNLEIIDEDEQSLIDSSKSEANGVAEMIAANEVDTPKEAIAESLDETGTEAKGYADVERRNASKAATMDGNFSSIGSDLSSSLEQKAGEYDDISDESIKVKQETWNQLSAISDSIKNSIG